MATQSFFNYRTLPKSPQFHSLGPDNPINPHASPQPEDTFWYAKQPRENQRFGPTSLMSKHRLALLKLVEKKRKARNPDIEDLTANLEREQHERNHLDETIASETSPFHDPNQYDES